MSNEEKIKLEKKIINIDIIFGMFLILVFAGKIVRYTIMKTTLVDAGAGHSFLNAILYGLQGFSFFDFDNMSSDPSGNSIIIFRLINFLNISTYEEWEIYISVIWNFILLILLFKVKEKLSIEQFIFIALSIIVLNIFDFTLAKEPIQMLYFIAIYYVLTSKVKNNTFKYILTILIILFSAITFRVYYFLIVMFMIFVQMLFQTFILKKHKVTAKDIVTMLILIVSFYFIFLNVVKVVMPNEYDELIRVRTRTSDAASDMRNIFQSTNLIVFAIDYLIMIIRMLLPIELLRLGIKYIPYVVYQIIITYFVIKAIRNIRYNSQIKNISLYLYIGFLFASAAFEPDFGSWVRHEAVVFPVLMIVTDCVKIKETNMKEKGYEKQDYKLCKKDNIFSHKKMQISKVKR